MRRYRKAAASSTTPPVAPPFLRPLLELLHREHHNIIHSHNHRQTSHNGRRRHTRRAHGAAIQTCSLLRRYVCAILAPPLHCKANMCTVCSLPPEVHLLLHNPSSRSAYWAGGLSVKGGIGEYKLTTAGSSTASSAARSRNARNGCRRTTTRCTTDYGPKVCIPLFSARPVSFSRGIMLMHTQPQTPSQQQPPPSPSTRKSEQRKTRIKRR